MSLVVAALLVAGSKARELGLPESSMFDTPDLRSPQAVFKRCWTGGVIPEMSELGYRQVGVFMAQTRSIWQLELCVRRETRKPPKSTLYGVREFPGQVK